MKHIGPSSLTGASHISTIPTEMLLVSLAGISNQARTLPSSLPPNVLFVIVSASDSRNTLSLFVSVPGSYYRNKFHARGLCTWDGSRFGMSSLNPNPHQSIRFGILSTARLRAVIPLNLCIAWGTALRLKERYSLWSLMDALCVHRNLWSPDVYREFKGLRYLTPSIWDL